MARDRTARRRYRNGGRLTAAGWVYGIIWGIMLTAAVRNDAAVALLLLGAMFGALAVSAFAAGRTVRAVRATREAPDRVWQGQTVHMSYFLANRSRWSSCMGLTLRDLPQKALDAASGYCAHLPARGQFRSGARFVALRRGRIRLDGIEISTGFPFGLIRAWRRTLEPANLIVWPARGELRAELCRRGAAEVSSARPSPISGGQDEFFGLREFREDDNPRLIHWKRSAGRHRPLVREMARPVPDVLFLIVDTAPSDSAAADLEKVLRLGATLIDHAMTRGYQVGLALANGKGIQTLPPATGRAQLRDLLDVLADIGGQAASLAQTLAAVRPAWLTHAQVVVVSAHEAPLDPRASVALAGRAGHLTVIGGPEQIDRVFADAPLPEAP